MAYVTPREGENPESLVNRFRASVQHSGILRELKDRRFFRSKAQKERLAASGPLAAAAASTAARFRDAARLPLVSADRISHGG